MGTGVIVRLVAAGLVVVAALAAGCGDPVTVAGPETVGGRTRDQGFVLDVAISTASLSSATPIAATATLTWTGPAPTQRLAHGANSPVLIGFDEIGGTRTMWPVSLDSCGGTDFRQGVPIEYVPQPGVTWSEPDPNSAFYRAFAAEGKDARLPSGRWRITILVDGDLGACGGPSLTLRVPLEVAIR